MAFRAKSSTHLISGSCWLWVMAYSHSRSPRDAEPGPSPVAARQRRMPALPPDARGLRKAGVSPAMLQSCNGPQRRSAIQPLKGRLASAGLPFSCTASLQRYGAREWSRHWSCGRSGGLVPSAGWQDSRAVRDSRGQCSEKGPSLARYARYAFPNGALQRFSDAWRAYLAKASSFWMHGGDMLPGKGAFPVRGPFGNA